MTDDVAAADRAVLDRWWRTLCATGALPPELPRQQGRLIRAVHRGELPSGPVFIKVMTFPRAKDRLRYLLRALPGEHEARLLERVAAAGIPCPVVVACRTARRRLLPGLSMLVLRALPTAAEQDADPLQLLHDQAALTVRLLRAGIEHRDLHGGNFLRLRTGELAVLDLQSVVARGRDLTADRRVATAAAARLLRDVVEPQPAHGAALQRAGLLAAAEVAPALSRAAAERARYANGRLFRCLQDGTEFTWRLRWWGIEHRLREGLADGRWVPFGARARQAWLGQRALQLAGDRALFFRGYAQKWWWLGGGGALYVPAASDERIQAEAQAALAGWGRVVTMARGRHAETK